MTAAVSSVRDFLRRGRQLLVPRRPGEPERKTASPKIVDDDASSDDGGASSDYELRSSSTATHTPVGLAGMRALRRAKAEPPAVTVYSWGRGSEGQLMLGREAAAAAPLADAERPTIVQRLTDRAVHNAVVDIAGGPWSTSFAVTMSGVVFASGSNEERQLHASIDQDSVPHAHIMASLDAHHVLQIAAGASHCAAITANRTVLTWGGGNSFGELGRGLSATSRTSSPATPLPLFGLSRFRAVQVSCGNNYTLTLTARGVLFSCGSGAHGCLGHGDAANRDTATPIGGALSCVPVASIAAGPQHCGCVTASGSVFMWGRTRHGRLGLGNLDAIACDVKSGVVATPCPVRALRCYGAVAQLACGHEHTVFLLAATRRAAVSVTHDAGAPRRAVATDDSDEDEEEDDNEVEQASAAAAATAGHGDANQYAGKVFAAGHNRSGQLGVDPAVVPLALSPIAIDSLHDEFVAISCGHEHTLALSVGGEVWAMGNNECSQLGGTSSGAAAGTPVCALRGKHAFRVLAVGDHSMALVSPAATHHTPFFHNPNPTAPAPSITTRRLLEVAQTRDLLSIKPVLDAAFGSLAQLSSSFRDRRIRVGNGVAGWLQRERISSSPSAALEEDDIGVEAQHARSLCSNVLNVRGLDDAYTMILASQPAVAVLGRHLGELAQQFRAAAASIEEVEALQTVPLALLQCPLLDDAGFSHALVNIAVGVQQLPHALKEELVAQWSDSSIVPRQHFVRCLVAPLRRFIDTNIMLTRLASFGGASTSTGAAGNDPTLAVPDLLRMLHRASDRARMLSGKAQAPAHAFHATVLIGMSDAELRDELARWQGRTPHANARRISLLNYPFLVDVLTKRRLLHEEAITAMGSEAAASIAQSFGLAGAAAAAAGGGGGLGADGTPTAESLVGAAVAQQLQELGVALARAPGVPTLRDIGFAPLMGSADVLGGDAVVDDLLSPYFIIRVRREDLLGDALRIIGGASPHMLRKPLRVIFTSEPGSDAGGVRRDFFGSLVASIFKTEFGMFSWLPSVRSWWFAPAEFGAVAGDYFVVGVVLALALYNHVMVDLHLPRVMYAALLEKTKQAEEGELSMVVPLVRRLAALRSVFPELSSTLSDILRQAKAFNLSGVMDEDEDPIAGMCIAFETQVEGHDGTLITHELVPGGSDTPVTSANARIFVSCYVDWMVDGSVRAQLAALRRGFQLVIGTSLLSLLDADDLELLLCGTPTLDFKALEKSVTLVGWEDDDDDGGDGGGEGTVTLRHFWSVVAALSVEQQRQLLRFATGCDRAPIGGLGKLALTIQKDGSDKARLPTASTCHRTLLLPDYGDDIALIRARLSTAIAHCGAGFGFL